MQSFTIESDDGGSNKRSNFTNMLGNLRNTQNDLLQKQVMQENAPKVMKQIMDQQVVPSYLSERKLYGRKQPKEESDKADKLISQGAIQSMSYEDKKHLMEQQTL